MGPRALGGDKERNLCARISVATNHHTEVKRLCGSSPAVPHISDPMCGGFRSAAGRKDGLGDFWWTRRALMLLAIAEVPDSFPAGVVDRVAVLCAAVPVSDEHGQSAALRHHLPD